MHTSVLLLRWITGVYRERKQLFQHDRCVCVWLLHLIHTSSQARFLSTFLIWTKKDMLRVWTVHRTSYAHRRVHRPHGNCLCTDHIHLIICVQACAQISQDHLVTWIYIARSTKNGICRITLIATFHISSKHMHTGVNTDHILFVPALSLLEHF